METTTFLPLLLVSSTLSCEEDHECGERKYCYPTGLCAFCTNCSIYSRKPHEWKSCSKSPKECGECLPGYVADTLTDGSMGEVCTQIKLTEGSRNIPGDPGQWSNWLYGALMVGIPLVALVTILVVCLKARACRVNRGEILKPERPVLESVNMRPPPYSSCGESPLLTRNTGGPEYHCGPVWPTDHQMNTSSYHEKGGPEYHCGPVWPTDHQMNTSSYHEKELDQKMCIMENNVDGLQQATPFEYSPEDLNEIKPLQYRPQSRTRSSCRPNDATDHNDKDDDNADGLSVTRSSGVEEVEDWSSSPNSMYSVSFGNLQSDESKAAKQEGYVLEHGCSRCDLKRKGGSCEHLYDRHSSLCTTDLRPDHSIYSLCSETDVGCICQVPVQCTSGKNLMKTSLFTSKFDSGFMSKYSVQFEKLHDDTSTENTQQRRDKPFSTEGESININIPVNVNVLNTVIVHK